MLCEFSPCEWDGWSLSRRFDIPALYPGGGGGGGLITGRVFAFEKINLVCS